MKRGFTLWLGLAIAGMTQLAMSDSGLLQFPKVVEAGKTFSIATRGDGKAVLYVIGPGQMVRRDVKLGEKVLFSANDICNAGHYVALLVEGSMTEKAEFDVISARQPASLSFLAKPSRLPVGQHEGISGVAYVFDVFRNLVVEPVPVSFQLSGAAGVAQTRTVLTHNGVAWIKMDSAPRAGAVRLQATAGNVSDKRVIEQVPGDPCKLVMSARRSGQRMELQTEPVRDCGGNPVSDGTVVTFTETYNGGEATVDVPLKRGVARAEMPAHDGAIISVAAGVTMGNEIRLEGSR